MCLLPSFRGKLSAKRTARTGTFRVIGLGTVREQQEQGFQRLEAGWRPWPNSPWSSSALLNDAVVVLVSRHGQTLGLCCSLVSSPVSGPVSCCWCLESARLDPGPRSPLAMLGMDPAASTQLHLPCTTSVGLHPVGKVSWSGHHGFLKVSCVLAKYQVKEEGKKGRGWELGVVVMVFHHAFL